MSRQDSSRGSRTVGLDYRPTSKQESFHRCGARYRLYGGAAGGGKLLSLETLIPTPGGWTTQGKLVEGDLVLDEHGFPTKVFQVHDVVEEPQSYRVRFDDGEEILAGAEHLWLTFTAFELAALTKRTDEYRAARRATSPSKIGGKKSQKFTEAIRARNAKNPTPALPSPEGGLRTTEEIAATLTVRDGSRANHAIPVAGALELPDRTLPLDPYLLGVWLGDGTTSAGTITTMDSEIEQAFVDAGFVLGFRAEKFGKKAWTRGVTGLATVLRSMQLLGNKHVPTEYLRASKAQRLVLLQGLMDTDGTVCDSGSVEFTNTNLWIAEAVRELVVSLGWKCRNIESRAVLNGQDYGPKWDVKWTPDAVVFRLERKASKQKLATRRTTKFRYVVSCDPIAPIPMRCITVANPTGLYLAGPGMVPTHNSHALLMEGINQCMAIPGWNAIILRETFPELEQSQIRRFRSLMPPESYVWSEQRRTATFPNGSTLRFGYCQSADDVYQYQGDEYGFIGFDEMTHFDHFVWEYLKSRNRSATGYRPNMAGASNPGGKGHVWVKNLFVSRIPAPGMRPDAYDRDEYAFIPAKLRDNPYLCEADPEYEKKLQQLPDHLRAALLDGSWDVVAGQYFGNWRPDLHTFWPGKPAIMPWWTVWASADWGWTHPAAMYLHAADDEGNIWTFAERVVKERTAPDVGYVLASMAEIEAPGNQVSSVWLSPDAWGHRESPRTVAEEMGDVLISRGIPAPERADHDRKGGWLLMYQLLEEGRWRISRNCKHLIECLPALIHDEKTDGDVLKVDGDDPADAARYGVKSYVRHGMKPIEMRIKERAEKAGLKPHLDLTSWNIQRFKIESEVANEAADVLELRGSRGSYMDGHYDA